jgi:hypothetical protein
VDNSTTLVNFNSLLLTQPPEDDSAGAPAALQRSIRASLSGSHISTSRHQSHQHAIAAFTRDRVFSAGGVLSPQRGYQSQAKVQMYGASFCCLKLRHACICAPIVPDALAPLASAQQRIRLNSMAASGGRDGDTDDKHLHSNVHPSSSQQKEGAGELCLLVSNSHPAKSVAIVHTRMAAAGAKAPLHQTLGTHQLGVCSVSVLLCWT